MNRCVAWYEAHSRDVRACDEAKNYFSNQGGLPLVDSCPYVIGIVRLLGRKWLVGHIIDLLGAVQSHPGAGGGWHRALII